jgi:hypothetical protein
VESLTIRISRSTHEILHDLAAKSSLPMTAIVDEAVRDYQRRKFWEAFDASCASLKANPEVFASYQREAALWESTLADGLEELPE